MKSLAEEYFIEEKEEEVVGEVGEDREALPEKLDDLDGDFEKFEDEEIFCHLYYITINSDIRG